MDVAGNFMLNFLSKELHLSRILEVVMVGSHKIINLLHVPYLCHYKKLHQAFIPGRYFPEYLSKPPSNTLAQNKQ